MTDASTPSFSQFMKAHRAAGVVSAHDHDDVERLACCGFGWGLPTSTIRVHVPPASDAPPPSRLGRTVRRRGAAIPLGGDPLGTDRVGPAE
jgi:hypothetical protein